MGKTNLSPKISNHLETNIGKVIIFCEGKTEKYYFEYLAESIKKNKYNEITIILQQANGNARTVLNYANKFLLNEENTSRFRTYKKYLVFDCDDPTDIQDVIQNANDNYTTEDFYELLISNYSFETWLLMHFENIKSILSKRDILIHLETHINKSYKKANKGTIREIIKEGNIQKAIENAKVLEKFFIENDKNILSDIQDMNPYTIVHKLVEEFLKFIS